MNEDPFHFVVSVEVALRAAVESDLEALEWMGLYEGHRDIIRTAFEAQQRGDALLLVAISGGFPVAQVWIDFARKRAQRKAVLWAVRTFFPLQGRGIGRRMLIAAEREIAMRGIHRAELEVEHSNEGALRFYKSCGWKMVGENIERLTIRDGDAGVQNLQLDVWVMEKEVAA
jgi:ribosomal protein S18 acetylase RimI-like enzyme